MSPPTPVDPRQVRGYLAPVRREGAGMTVPLSIVVTSPRTLVRGWTSKPSRSRGARP